jgi:site-specific DNA-methyltransferase (adenine-specific)
MKKGGAFYVWFASSNHIEFEMALKEAGLRVKQELIWDKGMVLGHSDYHWAYEPCLYGTHIDHNCTWYGDRTQKTFLAMNRTDIREMKKEQLIEMLLNMHEGRSCWKIDRDNVCSYIHPTQKPLGLAGRGIKNSSCAGQIVLDLFGGSGSTLMAAEQLGRKARLMEYDPVYCDKIIARWETFTGLRAEKAAGL